MRKYKYNIGDTIKIRVWQKSDGWLKLIKDGDFYYEDDVTIYDVLVIGRDSSNGELHCLCDFDPHSYLSYKVDWWHGSSYDIDMNKWSGARVCPVPRSYVFEPKKQTVAKQVHATEPGGMRCKVCLNFKQYADVNRDDGTFVCFGCSTTKAYLLKCKPLDEKKN